MSSINLEDKYRPEELPLYYQYRTFKWEQFFIGFFGAMAILGILMKIWNPPLWGLLTPAQGELLFQILMPIGFIGEAIVFIMMGFLKGDGYYEITPDKKDVAEFRKMASLGAVGGKAPGTGDVQVEFKLPDNIQRMLEEKLSASIDNRVTELSSLLVSDMEKTRSILAETNAFAANLHRFSGSLDTFATTLESVSSGLQQFENLNTETLSKSVTHVSGKLDTAGDQVTELQDELKRLTLRFHNFNVFPGAQQQNPQGQNQQPQNQGQNPQPRSQQVQGFSDNGSIRGQSGGGGSTVSGSKSGSDISTSTSTSNTSSSSSTASTSRPASADNRERGG